MADFVVTNEEDYEPGLGEPVIPGSFREAIELAKASPGPDTITFASGVNRINVDPDDLVFNDSGGLTINGDKDGDGAPDVELRVGGGRADIGFRVEGGSVTFEYMEFDRFIGPGVLRINAGTVTFIGSWLDGSLDSTADASDGVPGDPGTPGTDGFFDPPTGYSVLATDGGPGNPGTDAFDSGFDIAHIFNAGTLILRDTSFTGRVEVADGGVGGAGGKGGKGGDGETGSRINGADGGRGGDGGDGADGADAASIINTGSVVFETGIGNRVTYLGGEAGAGGPGGDGGDAGFVEPDPSVPDLMSGSPGAPGNPGQPGAFGFQGPL